VAPVELAVGQHVQGVADSSGVEPNTNRRSISLPFASAGRSLSSPMHTPTTTTREFNGAAPMMPSITPGTPTHSKITGRFRAARPRHPTAR